jgi:hypothetical protein
MDWATISEFASANSVYIGAVILVLCLVAYYMKDSFISGEPKKKSKKKSKVVEDDDSLSEEIDELSNSIEEKQKAK